MNTCSNRTPFWQHGACTKHIDNSWNGLKGDFYSCLNWNSAGLLCSHWPVPLPTYNQVLILGPNQPGPTQPCASIVQTHLDSMWGTHKSVFFTPSHWYMTLINYGVTFDGRNNLALLHCCKHLHFIFGLFALAFLSLPIFQGIHPLSVPTCKVPRRQTTSRFVIYQGSPRQIHEEKKKQFSGKHAGTPLP